MTEPARELMTPGEVAAAFGVAPRTVIRWACAGRLPCASTPGGHRRFDPADVEALLRECSAIAIAAALGMPLAELLADPVCLTCDGHAPPGFTCDGCGRGGMK